MDAITITVPDELSSVSGEGSATPLDEFSNGMETPNDTDFSMTNGKEEGKVTSLSQHMSLIEDLKETRRAQLEKMRKARLRRFGNPADLHHVVEDETVGVGYVTRSSTSDSGSSSGTGHSPKVNIFMQRPSTAPASSPAPSSPLRMATIFSYTETSRHSCTNTSVQEYKKNAYAKNTFLFHVPHMRAVEDTQQRK